MKFSLSLISTAFFIFTFSISSVFAEQKKGNEIVFEELLTSRLITKVKVRSLGVTLALPRQWGIASASKNVPQENLAKLEEDVMKRFKLEKRQLPMVLGIFPKKDKGEALLYSFYKGEKFDSREKADFTDVCQVAIRLYQFNNADAKQMATEAYANDKEKLKIQLKATISPQLQQSKINGIPFYFYCGSTGSYYFFQIKDHVLMMQPTSYGDSSDITSVKLSEMDKIINRVSLLKE